MSCNMSALGIFEKFADEYLNFEHTPKKNIFWLDSMKFLCQRLGNPELSAETFHVAGSKGKGSVSVMMASILSEAGYSTGLYTSPHILDLSERIGTARGPFEEKVYEESVRELMNSIQSVKTEELPGERPITWFELLTLLGMLCFKNAGCQKAVYEVGIGGRLDATNVILPKCCCINLIEKEHTEYLGNTLAEIAGEKAGIIKEGIPVFSAGQCQEVRDVFKRIARERNAPLFFTDEISKVSEVVYKNRQSCFTIDSKFFNRPLSVRLGMFGDYQACNAALAACAIKYSCPEIDEETIEKGLEKAMLSGRFEICDGIVYDGAHTRTSIENTVRTFKTVFGEKVNAHLIFGCAEDKDVEDMAQSFRGVFESITLTRPGNVKACDFDRIKRAFDCAGLEYTACSDFLKAIPMAIEDARQSGALLLVTGSFYLVSEVKKYLLAKSCCRD